MREWYNQSKLKYDESYIGEKNNHLTVIGIDESTKVRKFICRCVCGNIKGIKPTYWATDEQQANNKRLYKGGVEYKGKKYKLKELCKMFNTSESAIMYRMKHRGMTLEQALETPKQSLGRPRKEIV